MYVLELGELTGFRAGGKGRPDKTKVFTAGAIIGDKVHAHIIISTFTYLLSSMPT
jgi:hypothetical protein